MTIMSVVGIIAEYNPLHQGHAYHIECARKMTDASACVCILSSNFVQRGEPAVINKWARAKMALYSGADLVIELPSAFSCASAEYFASGSVSILESLNCIDYLCFGSEEGSLETLEKTAELLAFESDDYKCLLKQELNSGLSYAAARQKIIDSTIQSKLTENVSEARSSSDNKAHSILNRPNNILGVEYIKALKRIGSMIKPVTVERLGQDYNSINRSFYFSSATAIRRHIFERYSPDFDFTSDTFLINNLPQLSLKVLSQEIAKGRGPVFSDAFESIVLHMLRVTPGKDLARLPYISEGLENRLIQAAQKSVSFEELVSTVVTSRYPASRIRRILCSLITGMSADFLDELKSNGYAQYIRILGFNETGQKLLSKIRKSAVLPIITKPASYRKLQNPLAVHLFEHEIHSTDAYVLGYQNPKERSGGTELTTSPVFARRLKKSRGVSPDLC
jgi:predicted nucleotidyltransferase